MLARLFGRLPLGERRDLDVYVKIMEENRANAAEAGGLVTPHNALQFSAVFACVRILAETVASLPLFVYEREEKGKRRATEHYLYPLLHDAPNELMTAFEFRETVMGHLALWGNAYCQVDYDEQGRVRELWPLRPDCMLETRMENGRRLYWYQLPSGKPVWLAGDFIWHLRGIGSDGLNGYSPIGLQRRAVGLGLAAEEFGARFFENDARPGIVLEHPGRLSDLAYKNLKEQQEEEHKGVAKSHRMQILEEGMKLHEVGIPPEDAQFLQTRRFQVEEIARIFRVPPHMLADLEKATFSNIEHQGIEFVTHTVRPWCVRWEQSIFQNLMLESDRERFFAEFLVDGLLRGDTLSRYQAYKEGIYAGWFTRADAREKENLNEIEGLEKPLVPMNMMESGSSSPQPSPEGEGARGEGGYAGEARSSPAEEVDKRARTAAGKRHQLMKSYHRIYQDAAARVLRREKNDVGALAHRSLESENVSGFMMQMELFYKEHVDFVIRQMRPVNQAYGELVADEAAAEVEAENDRASVERFTQSYNGGYGARHVGISQSRLEESLKKAQAEGADLVEAVDEELESWPEVRAKVIADEEAVRFNNAMAKMVYGAAGRQYLKSVAFGKNCPYCDSLNGKVIGINEFFIAAGESFKPEGAEVPLTSTTDLGHAPYHGGCDCMVVAG